jgi:hypothetical protein
MHSVVNVFGRHPLAGVLVVIVAGAALFAWEYLHLTRRSAGSRYLLLVQGAAFGLMVVSLILIVSRFLAVEGM